MKQLFLFLIILSFNVIANNDWTPICFIQSGDDSTIIKLEYQEKYGSFVTIFCKAIFENKKTNELKCISPLINLTLQKYNICSFNYIKVKIN